MKTASIRDLRNSFAKVSRWLKAGETVAVTKQGQIFAHILPVTPSKRKRAPKPDILARLKADFGAFVVPDKVYEEMMREKGAGNSQRLP